MLRTTAHALATCVIGAALHSAAAQTAQPPTSPAQSPTQLPALPPDQAASGDAPALRSSGLARGVNFGNMLEAPNEGDWGLTVQPIFFDKAVEAGLDHIRLTVSWTHHADDAPPYAIDPVFMDRVDWCVDQALARGLRIIVNTHHYDELNNDPAAEAPRALAIWDQIAARMRDRPETVYFEVLNEPHGAFNDNPALWNAYLADALATIRQTNPDRWVLAGPVWWNSIAGLQTFDPPADPRLIATIHYYEPFEFTHQGADWVNPTPPVGTTWTGADVLIASPWDNWSWSTDVSSTPDGLRVRHQQGWAGLFFHRSAPLDGARRLTFAVDRALSLRVVVGNETDEREFFLQTADNPGEYVIDLPPDVPPADRVILQNASAEPGPEFLLTSCVLDASRPEPLLVRQRQEVDHAFRAAARWARQRSLPLYLGEFGAYSAGDIESRAAWTRAVRESAEHAGLAWGYWELAAGFGFYDPAADRWRLPLLRALTR